LIINEFCSFSLQLRIYIYGWIGRFQIGMAATCGNGYVFDKLLKKKKMDRPSGG